MKSFLLILGLIFVFATNIFAHPNNMMEYRTFFKFNGFFVTDIGESWTFDKLTSQELIRKYNVNKKGKLSKKESIKIAGDIMEGLATVRYFTYIFIDGKDIGKIKTSGYKVHVKNGIFTLAFNNHLPSPIDVTKSHLSIQVKDVDSTVITNIAKIKPVVLIGAPKGQCKVNIQEKRNRKMPILQDPFSMGMMLPPKEISVSCKKSK